MFLYYKGLIKLIDKCRNKKKCVQIIKGTPNQERPYDRGSIEASEVAL